MHGALLAAVIGVTPDNTPHGYNLTFAFPMLLFIIVAGVLYLRFRRPHRVPGHVALASSRWAERERQANAAGHAEQEVPEREDPAAQGQTEDSA